MKTRFSIDVPTGVITRYAAGVKVPDPQVGILTARDILDCEVVFTAGIEDITASVLSEGMVLRLGLRKVTSDGNSLAQSANHTMVDGVANCVFDMNTAEIVALIATLQAAERSTKVFFEAEVSLPNEDPLLPPTYRQTMAQQEFKLLCEVNMEGDEPPAPAAQSALTAGQHAAEAERQVGLAAAQVALAEQKVLAAQGKVDDAAAQVQLAAAQVELAAAQVELARLQAVRAENAAAAATGGMIPATEKGAPNGVATLGADGKVPLTQLAGVATLDAGGKVPTAQLTPDASKAPIESPELTGAPKATTPDVGDNSTRIATTAHVKAVVAAIPSGAVSVQTFTANGVWPKPAGAKKVHVKAVGGGAGGSSGDVRDGESDRMGGGGGGGGASAEAWFDATNLGATENVVVGSGGAGAAAPSFGNGLVGSPGGPSSFGPYMTATGGGAGSVYSSGGSGGTINGYTIADGASALVAGGGGASATLSGSLNIGQSSSASAGGGGAGGGVSVSGAGATIASTSGGCSGRKVTVANNGATGANGQTGANQGFCGFGGGGGGANGGAGGAGGYPGGGGGGAGGSTYGGATAKPGGNGGNGVVIVTTYF